MAFGFGGGGGGFFFAAAAAIEREDESPFMLEGEGVRLALLEAPE